MAWGIPVRELADRLSADDLQYYQAYLTIEPHGSKADDMRTAVIAHTMHASMGGKTKFKNFIPRWEPPEPLTYKQGAELFAMMFKAKKHT